MHQSTRSSELIEAYRLMRSGILFMFISLVIMLTSAVILFIAVGAAGILGELMSFRSPLEFKINITHSGVIGAYLTINPPRVTPPGPPRVVINEIAGALLLTLAFILIAAIIWLYGVWSRFIPGVEKLAGVDPEFSTTSTLIKLGYFWGILLLIIGIPTIIVIIGGLFILIGLILLLIGLIGVIILSFKLYEKEKDVLYLIAGVLFIIGIFVPILGLVGWILLYMALGDSIRRTELSISASALV